MNDPRPSLETITAAITSFRTGATAVISIREALVAMTQAVKDVIGAVEAMTDDEFRAMGNGSKSPLASLRKAIAVPGAGMAFSRNEADRFGDAVERLSAAIGGSSSFW